LKDILDDWPTLDASQRLRIFIDGRFRHVIYHHEAYLKDILKRCKNVQMLYVIGIRRPYVRQAYKYARRATCRRLNIFVRGQKTILSPSYPIPCAQIAIMTFYRENNPYGANSQWGSEVCYGSKTLTRHNGLRVETFLISVGNSISVEMTLWNLSFMRLSYMPIHIVSPCKRGAAHRTRVFTVSSVCSWMLLQIFGPVEGVGTAGLKTAIGFATL
jgi:hypothetical protein